GLSRKADELVKAMKSARTLQRGVEIGAQCMKLKATVRGLAENLEAAEGFLDEMQVIMKAGGLECDDSTIIQKLQKLDVATILESGKSLATTAYDICGLVKNVVSAVA